MLAHKLAKREQDKTLAEIVADQEAAMLAAREVERTPERQAEIERERQVADLARSRKFDPVELKPGTKVKVHIWGWRYDPNPAEVVHDNMDRMNRKVTVQRTIRGHAERETVNFSNVSLWRGA